MGFLNNLLSLLNERGISKNKLLTDLKLSKNSFVDWEKRGTVPSGDTLIKIAEYFDVSVDYLLGRTNIANFDEIKKAPYVSDERINLFFQLDEEDKDEVYGFMKMKLDKPKYKQDRTETA